MRKQFDHLIAAVLNGGIALGLTSIASGQSSPDDFTTVINVPSQTAPRSIGSSTQLNLSDGGVILADFRAGETDGSSTDVEVNISGGLVGDNFIATGSVVNVSGGRLADFFANRSSTYNISGGTLGGDFSAVSDGGVVNISGGDVDTNFRVNSGGIVNFDGGRLDGGNSDVRTRSGGVFNIRGGTIGNRFRGEDGSRVTISGGTVGADFSVRGETIIRGGEYHLNGVAFSGNRLDLIEEGLLTGTLEDGTPFVFSPQANDRLERVMLVSVPLPNKEAFSEVVDGASGMAPSGLRDGESLTLRDGGALGRNFALVGASLNIEGGSIGRGFEAVGSTVTMTGGHIGAPRVFSGTFSAFEGSNVSIEGGTINGVVNAFYGSQISIEGGATASLRSHSGSRVAMVSGEIQGRMEVNAGSSVIIEGGRVGGAFVADAGSTAALLGGVFGKGFISRAGSVELIGGEFRLNGSEYMADRVTVEAGDTLSGTLSDGSPFLFSSDARDFLSDVRLTRVTLDAASTTPFVVDAANLGSPDGLRPGQSLVLRDGGVLNDDFAAIDAYLSIQGGRVGNGLEAYNSRVVVDEGTIGRVSALRGSEFNVRGGVFEIGIEALAGSVVNIAGGRFESGEFVEGGLDARPGSVVNISGGVFADEITAAPGSTINLLGTEFAINGVLIDASVSGEPIEITGRSFFGENPREEVILSGRLLDGSSFSFSLQARSSSARTYFSNAATLTVNLVPEPAAGLVMTIGLALLSVRRACACPNT